jgi:hypothetical protein
MTFSSRRPVRPAAVSRVRSTRTYRARTGCARLPPESAGGAAVQVVPSRETRIRYFPSASATRAFVLRSDLVLDRQNGSTPREPREPGCTPCGPFGNPAAGRPGDAVPRDAVGVDCALPWPCNDQTEEGLRWRRRSEHAGRSRNAPHAGSRNRPPGASSRIRAISSTAARGWLLAQHLPRKRSHRLRPHRTRRRSS